MVTLNPFAHGWVAPRYAAARPNVHEKFVAKALEAIGSPPPFARGLDIGCGTGLSARALRRAAQRVVAIDPSLPMLRSAAPRDFVGYAAGRADAIPARDAAFDVASVCSAYHWCDRERLFAEVARVVRPGGWLWIYDSDLQGWADGSREPVERLTAEYWSFLPRCPRNPYYDPVHHVSDLFSLHTATTVVQPVPLSASELAALVFTQASTVMTIEGGHASAEELHERLEDCLRRLFAGSERRDLLFGGPLHVLCRSRPEKP